MVHYNIIDDYYIVLDKIKKVVYDSRIGAIDIEKYIEKHHSMIRNMKY